MTRRNNLVVLPTDSWTELAPVWAREMYANVMMQLGAIMAEVKVEQADLDALQTNLGKIADDLETELASLNLSPADLSGVQAVVDRLRNDVVVPTPPAAPTA